MYPGGWRIDTPPSENNARVDNQLNQVDNGANLPHPDVLQPYINHLIWVSHLSSVIQQHEREEHDRFIANILSHVRGPNGNR